MADDTPKKEEKPSKIDVLLRPAGDAPILKRKKWQVDPAKKVEWIAGFLRKLLKCEQSESIFLYVNQAFAPSPDRDIGTLYECFGGDGKLVLHYAKTQAWG
ncbi:ubiquitin-like protein ATG12 [Styela clava]